MEQRPCPQPAEVGLPSSRHGVSSNFDEEAALTIGCGVSSRGCEPSSAERTLATGESKLPQRTGRLLGSPSQDATEGLRSNGRDPSGGGLSQRSTASPSASQSLGTHTPPKPLGRPPEQEVLEQAKQSSAVRQKAFSEYRREEVIKSTRFLTPGIVISACLALLLLPWDSCSSFYRLRDVLCLVETLLAMWILRSRQLSMRAFDMFVSCALLHFLCHSMFTKRRASLFLGASCDSSEPDDETFVLFFASAGLQAVASCTYLPGVSLLVIEGVAVSIYLLQVMLAGSTQRSSDLLQCLFFHLVCCVAAFGNALQQDSELQRRFLVSAGCDTAWDFLRHTSVPVALVRAAKQKEPTAPHLEKGQAGSAESMDGEQPAPLCVNLWNNGMAMLTACNVSAGTLIDEIAALKSEFKPHLQAAIERALDRVTPRITKQLLLPFVGASGTVWLQLDIIPVIAPGGTTREALVIGSDVSEFVNSHTALLHEAYGRFCTEKDQADEVLGHRGSEAERPVYADRLTAMVDMQDVSWKLFECSQAFNQLFTCDMNGCVFLSHLIGHDRTAAMEAAKLALSGHGAQQVGASILLGSDERGQMMNCHVFLQFDIVADAQQDTLKMILIPDVDPDADLVAACGADSASELHEITRQGSPRSPCPPPVAALAAAQSWLPAAQNGAMSDAASVRTSRSNRSNRSANGMLRKEPLRPGTGHGFTPTTSASLSLPVAIHANGSSPVPIASIPNTTSLDGSRKQVRKEAIMLGLVRLMRHFGEVNFLEAARVTSTTLSMMIEHRSFFANVFASSDGQSRHWRCPRCKALNFVKDREPTQTCGLCFDPSRADAHGLSGQHGFPGSEVETFLAGTLLQRFEPGRPKAGPELDSLTSL
eukprot:TRINITY_DN34564_c0_g1_i1.p1 TRINITY_DN34564_c0_g1~~TRINITY_DN34564_c0_g1_i1.p1  ORF type:complete len:876 (+),score=139.28 TRINITY_DN34564_c0_g1_i1:126-2753(+)